jgi:hypothetical protein
MSCLSIHSINKRPIFELTAMMVGMNVVRLFWNEAWISAGSFKKEKIY